MTIQDVFQFIVYLHGSHRSTTLNNCSYRVMEDKEISEFERANFTQNQKDTSSFVSKR